MEAPKPTPQHEWLKKLVGEWTSEMIANGPPGEPPMTHKGKETVRALGDVWIVCEGSGDIPGGGEHRSIMSLGYDPDKKKYVGSFIASMMTYQWIYEGQVEGNALVLDTVGPSFTEEGKMAPYKDTITLVSDDERILTSQSRSADGKWVEFMKATYRRVK